MNCIAHSSFISFFYSLYHHLYRYLGSLEERTLLIVVGVVWYDMKIAFFAAYINRHIDPFYLTMSSRIAQTPQSACVSDCGCNHDNDTPSPSPSLKITGKEIVFADELSELTKIMDDDTHMVLCKPKSTPSFIERLSDTSILLLPEHLPSFEF